MGVGSVAEADFRQFDETALKKALAERGMCSDGLTKNELVARLVMHATPPCKVRLAGMFAFSVQVPSVPLYPRCQERDRGSAPATKVSLFVV
jgi:hypothetical protein